MRFIMRSSARSAFSLVELAIVLVILGLLAGGVLSGQSLIRAAQLRSVSTDISRFNTAISSFRDKYFALPGDLANATSFWGKDDTNCTGDAGTAKIPGTCNGDGNGVLAGGSGQGATAEIFQFWKQLALAGLIEGTYSGLSNPGSSSGRSAKPGYNVPVSKLGPNIGYAVENWGVQTGGVTWAGSYGNAYIFGGAVAGCCPTEITVLKPEEAWNIDSKLDDGKPAQGFVRTFYRYGYNTTQGLTQCTTTDVEATTDYNLSNQDKVCNFIVNTGY